MAAKPFESRIQNLVYNVDVGIGLRLIKIGLYLLFVFILMLLYTATQFRGLKDAEAMDYAQLGRNLAAHGELVTQCVRPLSMWYLIEHTRAADPLVASHPDILHPPLWPATLAAGFKLSKTQFGTEPGGGVYAPEQWVIIPLCHLFTLLTAVLVLLVAFHLFDRRIAFLAVTVYLLSDTVWSDSISGLNIPMVMFLSTAAWYAALCAMTRYEEGASKPRWILLLAVSLVFCALAFLTRYAAVVLVPGIAVFIGFSIRPKGWAWAAAFAIAFLVLITPWLARNQMVSGGPLGLAPYTALDNAGPYESGTLERSITPTVSIGKTVAELQTKGLVGLAKIYNGGLRSLGDGLFISLFLTAFFYRFVRPPVHRFRWCFALSMLLLVLIASVFAESTVRLLHIFWPLIIIYGLAFFFILLDRLQLRVRLYNLGVTILFIALAALPLVFTMAPPRAGVPYPPYFPPFIMHVSKLLNADELMCSDMPWATAWYGNRTSLLLPSTIDDFYEINDYNKRVSGLYFTTLTRNKGYAKDLLTGPERSWFPLLEGRIPNDFPLTQGFPLNNMDQLFLTDRVRWGTK
jgi:hypothetical protein